MKRVQHDATEAKKKQEIFSGGGSAVGGLGLIDKKSNDEEKKS